MVDIEAPTRVQPITFGGYQIAAPGFDSESFAAAVNRAFGDGLRVEPDRAPRTWRVTNPAHGSEYIANVHGCSCPASLHGAPCKHVAIVQLIETITTIRERVAS
jgi:hypothetical protein